MTTELTMLACSVALLIAQLVVSTIGGMTQFSLTTLVGNRETAIEGKAWVGRAQRAYRNMLEGLLPFAAVVLAAAAADISNSGNRARRATVLLGTRGLRRGLRRGHSLAAHRRLDGGPGWHPANPPATALDLPRPAGAGRCQPRR